MAEISSARKGEYFRILFEILLARPDGLPAREATAEVERRLTLAPYELEELTLGPSRFRKNFSFGTIDMVKAGWLHKHKGSWTVTEQGRQAYQGYRDPGAFYSQALSLYKKWRQSRAVSGGVDEGDEAGEASTEKSVQVTFEQAEEQAWAEIETYLRNMPPYDFQDLVAALLRAMGYHISWIAPPGKDGGIDILAWGDPLGTRPPRIKVQVKRCGQNIDVNGLRSFMAVLGEDDVGLFVTTSGFTKDARDEARTQEKRKVTLVDLERFFDLWVEHYPKLDDAARRRFPLQPIYFLAPGN